MSCTVTPNSLNFKHWIINPYNDIVSNADNSEYIIRTQTITKFDTDENKGRGYAPYVMAEVIQNRDFCLSCNVNLTSVIQNDSKVYSGICLLDDKYNRFFEVGIGSWNSSQLDTIPINLKRSTISSNQDVNISVTYTSSPSTFTYIDENGNEATGNFPSITYFNSEEIFTIPLLKIPKFVAFFLRGYGNHSCKINNIRNYGLNQVSSTIPSLYNENNYVLFENITTNSKTLRVDEEVNSSSPCLNLCEVTDECNAVEYITSPSICKLKKFDKTIDSFGTLQNNNLYIKKSKVDILSDTLNVRLDFSGSGLKNVIVDRLNIKTLIINSHGVPEYVIITDTKRVISARYVYTIVRTSSSTSPISSSGKLGLMFNIDNQKFVIVLNSLDFTNIKIINDQFQDVFQLRENTGVTYTKSFSSSLDLNSGWKYCDLIDQIYNTQTRHDEKNFTLNITSGSPPLQSGTITFTNTSTKNIKISGYKILVYETDNTFSASFILFDDTLIMVYTDQRIFVQNSNQQIMFGKNTNIVNFLRSDITQNYLELDESILKAIKSVSSDRNYGEPVDIEWIYYESFYSVNNRYTFRQDNNTVDINGYIMNFYNYCGYIIFLDVYGNINIITTTSNLSTKNKHIYRFVIPKFDSLIQLIGYEPLGPFISGNPIDQTRTYVSGTYNMTLDFSNKKINVNGFNYVIKNIRSTWTQVVFDVMLVNATRTTLIVYKDTNQIHLDYNLQLTFLWQYQRFDNLDIATQYKFQAYNNEQTCRSICDVITGCSSYTVDVSTNRCTLNTRPPDHQGYNFNAGSNFVNYTKDYGTFRPPNNKFIFS